MFIDHTLPDEARVHRRWRIEGDAEQRGVGRQALENIHVIGDAGAGLILFAQAIVPAGAAMMRSAWLGRPPAIAIEMEKVCQEALQAALDAIRPGATCEAPHLACQKVIDRAGFTENFKKRTGYSIGIAFAPDWGEGGILSLYSGVTTELQPGMTFHIPPALRIYGQFTVGVSETVVVTETGYRQLGSLARPLTLL